jgi:transcriptional regulator with XRE-family HTH domain
VKPSDKRKTHRPGTVLPNGSVIRTLRIKSGVTQHDLASLATVAKRTIERVERGEPVTLTVLSLIAKALEVKTEEIICFSDSDGQLIKTGQRLKTGQVECALPADYAYSAPNAVWSPGTEHDFNRLFYECHDLEFLEESSRDAVLRRLESAVAERDALDLVLSLLDSRLPSDTREQIAEELGERWCSEVRASIERILFSRPCAREADFAGAIKFAHAQKGIRGFLQRLLTMQPSIEMVWNAWISISNNLFESTDQRSRLCHLFIQGGTFHDAVCLHSESYGSLEATNLWRSWLDSLSQFLEESQTNLAEVNCEAITQWTRQRTKSPKRKNEVIESVGWEHRPTAGGQRGRIRAIAPREIISEIGEQIVTNTARQAAESFVASALSDAFTNAIESQSISHNQLGVLLDASHSTVWRLVNGHVSNMPFKRVHDAATILGCNLVELLSPLAELQHIASTLLRRMWHVRSFLAGGIPQRYPSWSADELAMIFKVAPVVNADSETLVNSSKWLSWLQQAERHFALQSTSSAKAGTNSEGIDSESLTWDMAVATGDWCAVAPYLTPAHQLYATIQAKSEKSRILSVRQP